MSVAWGEGNINLEVSPTGKSRGRDCDEDYKQFVPPEMVTQPTKPTNQPGRMIDKGQTYTHGGGGHDNVKPVVGERERLGDLSTVGNNSK